MQHRDEFDTGPDFKAALSKIFGALDRRDRVSPRKPIWSIAIVLSLVLFLGSVLWYSYPKEAKKREILSVPVIYADAGPYKIVPKDPGGMEIPHRDSTIFDTLRADRDEQKDTRTVENLIPDSEEPLSREQIFSGLKTEINVEGKKITTAENKPPVKKMTALDLSEKTAEKEIKVAPEVVKKATSKVAKVVPKPAEKPLDEIAGTLSRTEPASGVEKFSGGNSYFVQLASLRSKEAADDAWKDLSKSLSVLKPLEHKVEKADLGARGIYYRLQAGPFSEARARDICTSIKAQRPGGCLVIKN